MGLLTLYSGLLLPWLGGAFWLAFAESEFGLNYQVNRLRQAGYGFFLGYVILYLAIMANNELTGNVSWPGLMLFMLIFTIGGGIAAWRSDSKVNAPPLLNKTTLSLPLKALTVITLVLLTVHLVFMTVEVFTNPLYPWDAWTVWAYRAKAWYLTGGITRMVSPTAWMTATSTDTFSTHGWGYPLFPSVITYWAAASLGRWSETLINLPVLFAGLAIGMALFGQCRESGFNVLTSLLACYLLYSIPLFGTHIALAGYADLWMAGFTGLGFVALIRGSVEKTPGYRINTQLVIGLLMVGLGMLAKNEGRVWFLTALVMLALIRVRLSVLLLTLLVITAMIMWAWVLGITTIHIPLIGTLGYSDNQLMIPFIGNQNFEAHDIVRPYLMNFFAMGNWNLLWVLVLASLMLSIQAHQHTVQRIGAVFIGLLLVTQIFIFGFTSHGLFARDFTTINRLPMHFAPVSIFVVFLILRARFERLGDTKLTQESQNTDA